MARTNELTNLVEVIQIMEVDNTVKGVSFSITGHLSKTRNEIIDLIMKAGGEYHKTVSYNTKFLVTNNDWNKGTTVSSKLKTAIRQGVEVIGEQQFLSMISGVKDLVS